MDDIDPFLFLPQQFQKKSVVDNFVSITPIT